MNVGTLNVPTCSVSSFTTCNTAGRASSTAMVGMLVLLGFSGASGLWAQDSVSHWQDLLAGAKLERGSHVSSGEGAGSTVKMSWDLCRDGTFHSSHSSTASAEVPGSVSLSTNQVSHTGRWSVEIQGQEAFLVLTQRDGRRITYHLTSDGQTTSLNGDRVSHRRSPLCP